MESTSSYSVVLRSPPLRRRSNFVDSLKDPVKINESIQWGLDSSRRAAALLSLCCKLEILLEKQTSTVGTTSSMTNAMITILIKHINEVLHRLSPNSLHLKDYLDQNNLVGLFPTTLAYLSMNNNTNENDTTINKPTQNKTQTRSFSEEEYFRWMAVLNQCYSMAKQLGRDVLDNKTHKYIAHQIALLYQCISQLGEHAAPFKKRIEQHFDAIKSITEADKQPILEPKYVMWLEELTKDVVTMLNGLPAQITTKVEPLMSFIANPQT